MYARTVLTTREISSSFRTNNESYYCEDFGKKEKKKITRHNRLRNDCNFCPVRSCLNARRNRITVRIIGILCFYGLRWSHTYTAAGESIKRVPPSYPTYCSCSMNTNQCKNNLLFTDFGSFCCGM